MLRWSVDVLLEASKMLKTDQERYHGGSSTEEVAALASLSAEFDFVQVVLREGSNPKVIREEFQSHGTPVLHPASI